MGIISLLLVSNASTPPLRKKQQKLGVKFSIKINYLKGLPEKVKEQGRDKKHKTPLLWKHGRSVPCPK